MSLQILVTGGTGLVGRALQAMIPHELEMDPHVDTRFLSSKECDLRNMAQVDRLFTTYRPDVVIHLAACVGGLFKNQRSQIQMFEDNVTMNMNVVKACAKHQVGQLIACLSTCIFPEASTMVEKGYVRSKSDLYPLDPSKLHDGAPHVSNHGYAHAKRMLGFLCQLYREQGHNFSCVIPTNVYGPHDNFSLEDGHVIPSLIHRAYLANKKERGAFPVRGTGAPLRQFIYSEDLARLVWSKVGGSPKGEWMAVPPTSEVSIGKIATIIGDYFGVKPEFDASFSDGQLSKPAASTVAEMEWTPLKEGLLSTMEWFNANYDTVRK